ncbi:MAG: SurA N-terminal domain-containing protein [Bradymonadales bacterium]
MLQGFRSHKNSWFIYLIFGVIIVVFVFMFGLPSTDCASKAEKDLARVNKHTINTRDLRFAVLSNYDDNVFRSEQYPMLQRQVLDSLSAIYLMSDKAKEMGIRVTKDELKDYITNWERGNKDVFTLGFLRKNNFNLKSYERALERYQTSVKRYEEFKEHELLARHLYDVLASSLSVSDAELWHYYEQANTTAALDYIMIKPSDVEKLFMPVTDEQARAFAKSDADQVKEYYDANLSKFVEPEEVKLQQIVIQKDYAKLNTVGEKTNKSYQPKERVAILNQLLINEKADFDQAFIDYDESANKDNKGMGSMLPVDALAQALQEALINRVVGDVVSVDLGDTHVFAKIVERKERVEKPISEFEIEIAKTLINKKRVSEKLDEVSAKVLELAKSGQSLADALDHGVYASVASERVEAEPQPVATPQPVVTPEYEIALNAAKETLLEAGMSEADALEMAKDIVKDMLTEPAQVAPDAQAPVVAAPDSIVIEKIDRISVQSMNSTLYSGTLSTLGYYPDIVRSVSRQAENSVVDQIFDVGESKLIVYMKTKSVPEKESFEAAKADLRDRFLQNKQEALLGNFEDLVRMRGVQGLWMEQLLFDAKTNNKIYYNESALAQPASQEP